MEKYNGGRNLAFAQASAERKSNRQSQGAK